MKLVMFTPVSGDSAIGRVASRVTGVLTADGIDVAVVATESHLPDLRYSHHFDEAPVWWREASQVEALVAAADMTVFQVGNSFTFHEGALDWLELAPGVVCLHDFFLGHLFCGWSDGRPIREVDAELIAWYGDDVPASFASARSSPLFIELTRDAMPLTEWVCSKSLAVLTHSSWGLASVLRSSPGSVRVVDLAYDFPGPSRAPASKSANSQTLEILTIGHINENKRVRSVIEAIGTSPELRGRVVYRVLGLIEPVTAQRLSAQARALGVNVLFGGPVDQETLTDAIVGADVMVSLRWPTLEAASASAIESMLAGKATVVTRAGAAADLPEDCVVKIDMDDEVANIRAALERLSRDPLLRRQLGERAQAHAVQHNAPARYADALLSIVGEAADSRLPIEFVREVAVVLAGWSSTRGTEVDPFVFDPLAPLWPVPPNSG